MELWVILLVLWVAWKVVGAVFDEMQNRKRQQQTGAGAEDLSKSSGRKAPPVTRPVQRTRQTPSAPPPPRGDENDLERLLREALSRKRQSRPQPDVPASRTEEVAQVESESLEPVRPAPDRTRPPVRVEPYHQAGRPRPTEAYKVEPPPPPPARHRMEAKPTARRVESVLEKQVFPTPTPALKVRRGAQVRRRAEDRQRLRSSAGFPFKDLNLCQVRRGIILSEVLGPPKALRETEAPQAYGNW